MKPEHMHTTMEHPTLDARLDDWPALQHAVAFTGLLLGNGASRAVWRNFAYDSLFERARTVRNKPLSLTDLALFKSLGNTSFEQTLGALNATVRVNAALAISSTAPLNRYYSIKEALIHAVRSVHIPSRLLSEDALAALASALSHYPTVYSSNYDLLCPWAVRHRPEAFDELMDPDLGFDLRRTTPARPTRVLYLHGGLHLIKNSDGSTRSRAAQGGALLDGFAINTPGDVPLLVNEGHADDKQRAIRDSDYLSWCQHALSQHQGPLCVFGHSLAEQDQHLVQALLEARPDTLALSIFPLSDAWIISQKQHFQRLFAHTGVQLAFFDATSHPLGRPALNVPVPRKKK